MNTNDYKEIKTLGGTTIDAAVAELLEYNKMGEKVYAEFNGVKLYSDTVTLDGAYIAITGKTKAECEAEREAMRQQWLAEEAEWQEKIPAEIERWTTEGHKVLDEKYWALWDECVPIRVDDIYRGNECGATLEIVKALNEGCDLKTAKDILDSQGHSGTSESRVFSMVKSFCDRGKDFYDSVRKPKVNVRKSDDYER